MSEEKDFAFLIRKSRKIIDYFTVHYMIVITFKDCKYSFRMSESVKKKKKDGYVAYGGRGLMKWYP